MGLAERRTQRHQALREISPRDARGGHLSTAFPIRSRIPECGSHRGRREPDRRGRARRVQAAMIPLLIGGAAGLAAILAGFNAYLPASQLYGATFIGSRG